MFYPGPSSPLSGEDDFENVALSNSKYPPLPRA